MVKKVSNIMDENFMKVDILDGVKRIQENFYEKNIECFVVFENKSVVGIITGKELVMTHPNRISADAMSKKLTCINASTTVWRAKEIFDYNKDIEIILVEQENEIIGFVTKTTIEIELGKHIDLLTGLYKREYIIYNAYKMIESCKETSILFIDLNNFGYIDKKYGHINGDNILKGVSEVLRKNISEDERLCRYAGDEFAILTPYSTKESRLLAEKLLNSIEKYNFPNAIPVSASIGITGCKKNNNIQNKLQFVNNLINMASLASTKAKMKIKEEANYNSFIVIDDTDINAIA